MCGGLAHSGDVKQPAWEAAQVAPSAGLLARIGQVLAQSSSSEHCYKSNYFHTRHTQNCLLDESPKIKTS